MMNNTNINYNELCTKLRSMKMSGMAEAFEKQLANPNSSLRSFDERISEIITAENDIYLSKINEILLINEVNEVKKDEDNIGTKINMIIIIIVIAICVVILGAGTFFVVCCWKKKCKRNKIEKEKNKSNEMEKPKIQDKSISKTIRSLDEMK